MMLMNSRIRIFLQIMHFGLNACAVFVNLNDVAERNASKAGKSLRSYKNIGFIMCARKCEALPLCDVFSFLRTELLCELHVRSASQQSITGCERDTTEDRWYVDNVEWLQYMDLSSGTEDKTCGPNESKIKLASGTVQCIQSNASSFPSDCGDPVIASRNNISGEYRISPQKDLTFNVYCDFQASGGPWTVVQARVDDDVSFNRPWADYKCGFGSLVGNFWLGNENLHQLLSSASYTLRIDIEYFDGEKYYADYSSVFVASEQEKYRLDLGAYSGTAGDSLQKSYGKGFTTMDSDNDDCPQNCATARMGGFWYSCCTDASLTGVYYNKSMLSTSDEISTGIWWKAKRQPNYNLKKAQMKVRKKIE